MVRLYRPMKAFLVIALIWLPLKSNALSLVSAANGPMESSTAQEILFRLKSNNSKCGVAFIAFDLMVDIMLRFKFKYFNLDKVWNVPNVISSIWFPDRSKWTIRCVNSQQSFPMELIELLEASNHVNEVKFRSPSLFNPVNWLLFKSLLVETIRFSNIF